MFRYCSIWVVTDSVLVFCIIIAFLLSLSLSLYLFLKMVVIKLKYWFCALVKFYLMPLMKEVEPAMSDPAPPSLIKASFLWSILSTGKLTVTASDFKNYNVTNLPTCMIAHVDVPIHYCYYQNGVLVILSATLQNYAT